MFKTPVLFLVFNRPETTQVVFEQIRKIKPAYLFIAADGPRRGREEEISKCNEVRELILSNIDWECQLETLFRNENLGCGKAVSQGITWFFEHVEEGIILEDDTVPDLSFFKYCEILLQLYRNNSQVMHISGCYFLKGYEIPGNSGSFYFTRHIHVWGWATWKRAWEQYDFEMKSFLGKRNRLQKYYGKFHKIWDDIFLQTYNRKIDTWDYQWMYAIYSNNGIAINPTTNLIRNIGFSHEATHTKNTDSKYNSISTEAITNDMQLVEVKIDKKRDNLFYRQYMHTETLNLAIFKSRLSNWLKRILAYPVKPVSENKISKKEFERLKGMLRFQKTGTNLMGRTLMLVDASSFLSSYYEIFEHEIYKFRTYSEKPIIIDCGANIGLATIYFKLNYPNATVLAYEPDPEIFTALKYNIRSFGFDNVELFNEAIGEKGQTLLFNKEGGHSGMLATEPGRNTVPVAVTPLKDILARFGVIDFLKIDIEGYEINVLPGIAGELKKVDKMFLEYHTFLDHQQKLSDIIKIIEDAGFRYYIKEGAYKKNPYLERELFYKMDMLINIFCYR